MPPTIYAITKSIKVVTDGMIRTRLAMSFFILFKKIESTGLKLVKQFSHFWEIPI